jgi:hypothetical protein
MGIIDHPLPTNSNNNTDEEKDKNLQTTWRFLEVFTLSNGHYFGFESTTIHRWYLTRGTVDIVSSIIILIQLFASFFFEVPKSRFKELGSFAPMIFEKLRQDFLNIYPTELFIRNSYIKNLKNTKEISTIKFNTNKKRLTSTNHDVDFLQKLNWIPEQNILRKKKRFF